jgi:hypothetical protein
VRFDVANNMMAACISTANVSSVLLVGKKQHLNLMDMWEF